MSIEFEKMTTDRLNQEAIVPQGLDNQWTPTSTLKRLVKKGMPLISWEGRKKAVLSEWRRALIYAPQVVVNRAALINNSIVVDDYSGGEKKYFQELLRKKIIIDYLLADEAPDQRPMFEISDEKWHRWLDVIQDTKLACVRINWGEKKDDLNKTANVFHEYVQTLNMPDRMEQFNSALKVPKRYRDEFRKKLIEVAKYAFDKRSQGKIVSRDELYKEFVCVENSKVDDGYYDKNKPFAAELKEIFDLRYNTNFPDAFGRYAFTPKGSPDRTILGDFNKTSGGNWFHDHNVKDFVYFLKTMRFTMFKTSLYLKGLHVLSLADVLAVRDTDEWERYTQNLTALLRHPMRFSENIDGVATGFNELNCKITKLKIANTKGATNGSTSRLRPWMAIVVNIGGASLRFVPDSTDSSSILIETLSGPVAIGKAPFTVNLEISSSEIVDFGISVNFLRSKVDNGRDVLSEIQGAIKDDTHFKILDEKVLVSVREANQSKYEIDWNEVLG